MVYLIDDQYYFSFFVGQPVAALAEAALNKVLAFCCQSQCVTRSVSVVVQPSVPYL